MISKAMFEKAERGRRETESALMAMPKAAFEAMKVDVIRKASRKNADGIWIALKVTMERVDFLRKGGTIEEYREIVKARIEKRCNERIKAGKKHKIEDRLLKLVGG